MKKLLSVLIISGFLFLTNGYDKLSLVERFTNASCGPCASINNAWYNATTANLLSSGSISHIIYNVWWPGANDPMYLLNQNDNTTRTNFYGVNAVPHINVNGSEVNTASSSYLTSAVNSGNAQFAPFNLVISQGVISNNLIQIQVKIIRDPNDVSTFGDIKLRVALTEKTVAYTTPPGSNGESRFYSVCRKMMPNASGSAFTVPSPGDSVTVNLEYIPSAAFLQSVNMDSIRVVAFIQDDNTREIFQSNMREVNQNYMATLTTQDENYFGSSGETATYTAYIKNIGVFQDTYNVNLGFEGPAGWTLTFTTVNGTFDYGETDAITLNPGDSTQVQANVSPNFINGYGKTAIQFLSNQGSFGYAEYTYTTFGLDVLVVDDDGGEDYEVYFQNELINLNSDYGIAPADFVVTNVDSLNTYNIIIWNTAVTEPGLSTDEINAIKIFLDNGGNLYLNGVDLAYQLADPSSPYYSTETLDFFNNYLHADYVLREHSATITQGIAGDPITGDLPMTTLVGGTGANTINHSAGRYVNQISANGLNNANILSFWLKPDEHPAIRTFHGLSGKIVFTAFGFETIALSERRELFAQNLVEWLSTPVSVEDNETDVYPSSFELSQNYPNPFNPVTIIKYQVPSFSHVSIKVYDLVGREVAVLVNEQKAPGSYQVNFESKNLASGIYFYKMITGEFTSVKKMNLLK